MSLNKKMVYIGVFAILMIASCEKNSIINSSNTDASPVNDRPVLAEAQTERVLKVKSNRTRNLDLGSIKDMQDLNQKLAAQGIKIRIAYAETITLKDEAGRKKMGKKGGPKGRQQAGGKTIYANDHEKRLSSQWVPGDDRRLADGNNLTYLVYEPLDIANYSLPGSRIDSEPEIDASFDTWNAVKKNPKLNIVKVESTTEIPSIILGSYTPAFPDIAEVGFLPGIFFEIFVGPGASNQVLGVTFTFLFVDENGVPTDINNDGHTDIAFKEVWYNDQFLWKSEKNGPGVDIQTVALHENGHALGFGHFGKIFITNANGKLHVAPRAVMNAIVLGVQRNLLGTDKASYNSIYGSWPRD